MIILSVEDPLWRNLVDAKKYSAVTRTIADSLERMPQWGKELLGSYFVQDVQGNAEKCRSLLLLIEDIQAGTMDNWEQTGNAFDIVQTQNGVTINNIWDESLGICEVSLDELGNATMDWLEFLIASR